MFVKKMKYLYLAILTTHFENQRVSGSASSDHLFINSLFKKKSITKHCNFFRGELQRSNACNLNGGNQMLSIIVNDSLKYLCDALS